MSVSTRQKIKPIFHPAGTCAGTPCANINVCDAPSWRTPANLFNVRKHGILNVCVCEFVLFVVPFPLHAHKHRHICTHTYTHAESLSLSLALSLHTHKHTQKWLWESDRSFLPTYIHLHTHTYTHAQTNTIYLSISFSYPSSCTHFNTHTPDCENRTTPADRPVFDAWHHCEGGKAIIVHEDDTHSPSFLRVVEFDAVVTPGDLMKILSISSVQFLF